MRNENLNGIVYKNEVVTLDGLPDHDELYQELEIDNSDDRYVVFRQNWWSNGEWDNTVEVCGKSKKVFKSLPDIVSHIVSDGHNVTIGQESEVYGITTVELKVS